MERKQHIFLIEVGADVLPCHVHISVPLWVMDLDSMAREKNADLKDEMLSKVCDYLIQGPCHLKGCLQKDPNSHWKIWRSLDLGQETKIKVVLLHTKAFLCGWIVPFCLFVFLRQKYTTQKDEQKAMLKDEKTPCTKTKIRHVKWRKDETDHAKRRNSSAKRRKNAMRKDAI